MRTEQTTGFDSDPSTLSFGSAISARTAHTTFGGT